MRDPAIDYLRGISIVLVVAMHYCFFFFGGPRFGLTAEGWTSFYRNGAYGVTIFFVLSGFLITSTSMQRFGTLRQISPKRFYWLRAARIYPLLILLLAVLLVLHFSGVRFATVEPPHRLGTILTHIATNRANWYLVTHGSIGLPWDVLWSLAVEEMFYLVFPLLAALVPGRLLLVILGCVIGLGPVYRTNHVLWDYFSCVDQLAIGCVVAVCVRRGTVSKLPVTLRLASLVIGAVTIGATYFYKSVDRDNRVWGPTLVALGAALIILATRRATPEGAASPTVQSRIWDWVTLGGIFRALGRSSYELYLFHGVVMVVILAALPRLQPLLHGGPGGPDFMLLVVYTTVVTTTGYLSRRFYSEPLNRWLRQRADRFPTAAKIGV